MDSLDSVKESTPVSVDTEDKSQEDSLSELSFRSLGIEEEVLKNLESLGIQQATPIQQKTIPFLLEGKDVIAQAKTGSGKTLAFALPAIQRISKQTKTVATLVLTPTRELAQQVAGVCKNFSRHKNIDVACVIGQESYSRQIRSINQGAQIVIATPGRLLDLLQSKSLKNFEPQTVVFDEADEMLNMGFIEDIKSILALLPKEKQTVFFSATFSPTILKLAKAEQVDPVFVRLDQEKQEASTSIEQFFYLLKDQERKDGLVRLFDCENPHKAVIFCRTKDTTEMLCHMLTKRNYKAKAIHSGLSQSDRNNTIREFKSGACKVLIATDIASRGLDVDDLSHVFNFHTPENYDRYTHRIGRTGRAGRSGKSFTFTTASEWSSNSFLRKLGLKNTKISMLPRKEEAQVVVKNVMINKIEHTEFSLDTKVFCQELLSKQDPVDLVCKLFRLANLDKGVRGPENIGFSELEINNFIAKSKRRASERRSRPYGRSRNFSSSRPDKKNFSRSRRRR